MTPRPPLVNLRAVADELDPPENVTVIAREHQRREVGRWLHELYGSNYERDNPPRSGTEEP